MTELNENGDTEYSFYKPQPIEWPTLRDRFAMAALPGVIQSDAMLNPEDPCTLDELATDAYCYADAMLKARKDPS